MTFREAQSEKVKNRKVKLKNKKKKLCGLASLRDRQSEKLGNLKSCDQKV
jgi:hypothetical protein